jgi:hypothetical protein
MRRNRGELRALFFRLVLLRTLAEFFFFVLFAAEALDVGVLGLVELDLAEGDALASVAADCATELGINTENPAARTTANTKNIRFRRNRRRWKTTVFNYIQIQSSC